jgi:hypothetical protein
MIGCSSDGHDLNGLVIPNNRYVFIQNYDKASGFLRYAGFEVLEQDTKTIAYRWFLMHDNDFIADPKKQNFKLGKTTGFTYFGVGFDQYSFDWTPDVNGDHGKVSFKIYEQGTIMYCLSDQDAFFNINLKVLMKELEGRDRCVKAKKWNQGVRVLDP